MLFLQVANLKDKIMGVEASPEDVAILNGYQGGTAGGHHGQEEEAMGGGSGGDAETGTPPSNNPAHDVDAMTSVTARGTAQHEIEEEGSTTEPAVEGANCVEKAPPSMLDSERDTCPPVEAVEASEIREDRGPEDAEEGPGLELGLEDERQEVGVGFDIERTVRPVLPVEATELGGAGAGGAGCANETDIAVDGRQVEARRLGLAHEERRQETGGQGDREQEEIEGDGARQARGAPAEREAGGHGGGGSGGGNEEETPAFSVLSHHTMAEIPMANLPVVQHKREVEGKAAESEEAPVLVGDGPVVELDMDGGVHLPVTVVEAPKVTGVSDDGDVQGLMPRGPEGEEGPAVGLEIGSGTRPVGLVEAPGPGVGCGGEMLEAGLAGAPVVGRIVQSIRALGDNVTVIYVGQGDEVRRDEVFSACEAAERQGLHIYIHIYIFVSCTLF